jgi:formate hydrogenlyase subunit 3/multisubunit Na+/H+ antiporter MnhD subunit
MSEPTLIVPGPFFVFVAAMAVATIAYFLHRWPGLSGLFAAAGCLALGWVSAQQRFVQPADLFVPAPVPLIGGLFGRTLVLDPSFSLLGREWVFTSANLAVIAFIWIVAGLAFLLALPASQGWSFYAFGTTVVAVLSLAVTARHYVDAMSLLWLSSTLAAFVLAGGRPGEANGAFRLLAFTSIAMIPLLILPAYIEPAAVVSGFTMPSMGSGPLPADAVLIASALMVVGFGILMMMVPFHGQLVAMAAYSAPMAAPFMLSVLAPAIYYLFLQLGQTYPPLLEDRFVYDVCRWTGIGAVALGGLSAMGQRRWGALMGYAMLVDWGAGLIALGRGTMAGAQQALLMVVWRALSLLLVGTGLTILVRETDKKDDIERCAGLLARRPLSVLAVVGGLLSLAAFPLTPGAAGRWPLIADLFRAGDWAAWVLVLGGVGVGVGAIAALARCAAGPATEEEKKRGIVVLDAIAALLALLLVAYLFLNPMPWTALAQRFLSGMTLFAEAL